MTSAPHREFYISFSLLNTRGLIPDVHLDRLWKQIMCRTQDEGITISSKSKLYTILMINDTKYPDHVLGKIVGNAGLFDATDVDKHALYSSESLKHTYAHWHT